MASPRLHRASCRCRHCAATCRDASGLVHRTDRSAPDGPAIIYVDPAASTVKTLGIDGAEQMTLTIHRPGSDWWRPAFSWNGKKLASVLDGASCDLYLVNPDLPGLTTVDDTIAFAKLLWWQAALGLLIWPYYLGLAAVAAN